MGLNWKEAIKEQQKINEKEQTNNNSKFETKYENWKTWVFSEAEWENYLLHKGMWYPWNYERKKLYNMLGMKVIKTDHSGGGSYKTGEYQFTKTSSNTYNITEKTARLHSVKHYVVGVDTTKITDIKKWEDIKNRIDIFLTEAQSEFKKIKEKSLFIGIAPSYFNFKDRIKITWVKELIYFVAFGSCIISIPFWLAYRIYDHINYNKKNTSAMPLVDAYFEQVKKFEKEISEIMIP